MKAISKRQNGVTFGGFLMILVLVVVVAIFGLKLIPAYMEDGKIQHAFDSIARDPDMQNATVADIRDAYFKRAVTMDDVTKVSPADIEIGKENGHLSLSAKYSVKIPLAGNVSLIVEFSPSSAR
jgi:hypothetical protein